MLLGIPDEEDRELIVSAIIPALERKLRRLRRYHKVVVDLFDVEKSHRLIQLGFERSMVCVYLGEESFLFAFERLQKGKIRITDHLRGVVLDDPLIRVVTYCVDRSAYK